MSGKATGWALDQGGLHPTTKLVLVAIADECRRDGNTSWPKRRSISDCVGVEPRQISRHLEILEEKGLIKREERRRENGARTSTLYHLAIETPLGAQDKGGAVPGDKGADAGGQGGPCPPGQGHYVEPTQNEPGEGEAKASPSQDPPLNGSRSGGGENSDEIWTRIKVQADLQLPGFRPWSGHFTAAGVEDGCLVLTAPASPVSWAEKRYRAQLVELIREYSALKGLILQIEEAKAA